MDKHFAYRPADQDDDICPTCSVRSLNANYSSAASAREFYIPWPCEYAPAWEKKPTPVEAAIKQRTEAFATHPMWGMTYTGTKLHQRRLYSKMSLCGQELIVGSLGETPLANIDKCGNCVRLAGVS